MKCTNFIQLNSSLNDEKKLENWEKYGNPNGPDAAYYEDKYPDFIANPPKTFVFFYLAVIVIVLLLPVSLFVIPFLKSPPEWIRDGVEAEISKGDTLLTQHNKDSIAQYEKARKVWEDLVKTFPRYSQSVYFTYYQFKISARIAQYKIFESDVRDAVAILSDARKYCDKDTLKTKEIQLLLRPVINNVVETADACGLKKSEVELIRTVLSNFQK